MLDWIKSHKILFVLSCIGVITMLFGIPFVINLLFKTPAVNELFQAEWDAGDALGYYGAVLSFIGTVVLGALALYQNHIIKLLIDRDMKKKDLCAAAGISHASMAKLGKNENVTTDVLVKICTALQCDIGDIMELTPTISK